MQKYRKFAPTAIRQDISFPSLQGMSSSHFLEGLLAGLEAEVVRVIETEFASCLG